MPTITENRKKWTVHDWIRGGHEWSPGGTRAGTDMFWWRSIMPRVAAHLPAGTLLEIAPGFGRWTEYLMSRGTRLIAVDVTERCVEMCRERFREKPHAEFHLNDGESLPMVETGAVDFAFSFDSFVHVDAPQVGAYLRELARVLKPGASGFIHHSNLAAYSHGPSGAFPEWLTERHWRAASVSAAGFRAACRAAGLQCVSQEMINWVGRGARADQHRLPGNQVPLTDCFSVLRKPGSPGVPDRPTLVHVNRRFVDEWRQVQVLAAMYGEAGAEPASGGPEAQSGLASRIGRLAAAPVRLRAYAAKRMTGRAFMWNEGIARAVAAGACPDCGTRLSRGAWKHCPRCNAAFALT